MTGLTFNATGLYFFPAFFLAVFVTAVNAGLTGTRPNVEGKLVDLDCWASRVVTPDVSSEYANGFEAPRDVSLDTCNGYAKGFVVSGEVTLDFSWVKFAGWVNDTLVICVCAEGLSECTRDVTRDICALYDCSFLVPWDVTVDIGSRFEAWNKFSQEVTLDFCCWYDRCRICIVEWVIGTCACVEVDKGARLRVVIE